LARRHDRAASCARRRAHGAPIQVILGGLDSIIGSIVGGLTIGVLENLAEFFDSQWLHIGNMYNIAPFYALVIILMIKPYGLFGTKDIERI
jgi:branched-chain amino acid transport system permease protein